MYLDNVQREFQNCLGITDRAAILFSRAALICGVEDVGGLVERLTQVRTLIAAGVVERAAGKLRTSR